MQEASPATETPVRRRPRPRRVMLGIVVAILLGIFVPPLVNVNRYRTRIASSISTAVGRPATVGGVELRLLPQPGFDLHNVEIGDDPSISSEYLLHAEEVTAYLRLSSLWRGRLEIARLSLTAPSLNVVRAEDGRWNLETLLSRTTQIPSAPTAQAHPEVARRRFPYIEATGGRINFKFGLEKKAFTFTEADFALWLASENNWRMRLEARPYRVDTKITDSGSLKLDGSFQRNSTLRYTPVKFNVTWRDGQLGQVTKLLTGRDLGWRGRTSISLNASGTPQDLALVSDLRIEDFRRYDIFGGGDTRLGAHCVGRYVASEENFSDMVCQSPAGSGTLEVRGTVQRLRNPSFDLVVLGRSVPMSSAMALIRHAKRDLPEDLAAGGTADFELKARRGSDAKTVWSGSGTAENVVLHSQALGPDLAIGTVQYAVAPEMVELPHRPHTRNAPKVETPAEANQFRVTVAPFGLALGASAPTSAQATVSSSGFNVGVNGDSDLARAMQVARALGIDVPKVAAKGTAHLDLHIIGQWTGFAAPEVNGTAQLKNVVADVPGLIETVQVTSATAVVDNAALRLQNIVAAFPKGPSLTGSVAIPRNCSAAPCVIEFNAHADELSPERLNQLLNPQLRSRPWYNFFMPHPAGDVDPLKSFDAAGQFAIDRWNMEGVVATRVSGTAKVADQRVTLVGVKGELMGGEHAGDWQADFSGDKPVFNGKGKLSHANLTALSTAMQDAWATGTADVSYQLKMTGATPEDLKSSASGLVDFAVKDGTLRRMGLDGKSTALKVNHLEGTVELREGNFVVSDAKLQSGAAVYTVQGTAAWTRQINFKIADQQRAYELTGTLSRPEVKQSPAAEAALQAKP